MKKGDLDRLQEELGHRFADPALLQAALTHPSAVKSGSGGSDHAYERLEFLGDRVLGLLVAEMLQAYLPRAPEGELSRRLAKLVSGETCAAVAREMDLARYLRINGARATTGILGDASESLLGALYRDGGLPAARQVVERYWRPRLQTMSGPLRDAKTELQEWAHRRGFDMPSYAEILRSGPDHAPEFEIRVQVGTLEPGRGKGKSKRDAEQEAAAVILRREGVWEEA